MKITIVTIGLGVSITQVVTNATVTKVGKAMDFIANSSIFALFKISASTVIVKILIRVKFVTVMMDMKLKLVSGQRFTIYKS